jgi:hypothetical protein
MIIKAVVIEVNESVGVKTSIGDGTFRAQNLLLLHLELHGWLRLPIFLLFYFFRILEMPWSKRKDRQGPRLYNFLIEESSCLFVTGKDDFSSRSFDVEQLGGLGKGKSFLLDHLNELYSFLNRSKITSVEILEYLFLCLEFYALSAILLLIIFPN